MTFLPIVTRELMIAARRSSTYNTRCLVAGVVIAVSLGAIFAGAAGILPLAASGSNLFYLLAVSGYIFLVGEGSLGTADCLSREKRDGTLGLLFLTSLHGFDVILGKMTATSIRLAYGLFAAIPAPAMAFVIGGIGLGDFFGMILAQLDAMFLAMSIGIFVSSMTVDHRKSVTGALFCAVGWELLMPWLSIAGGHPRLEAFLQVAGNFAGPDVGPLVGPRI